MGRDQRHLRHVVILAEEISIHSPRMGRDGPDRGLYGPILHFNPLSPHGERQSRSSSPYLRRDFNPLSPHGERQGLPSARMVLRISIHSPRMGRGLVYCKYTARMANFNPLSPHGERLRARFGQGVGVYFNPLSPHGERLLNAVHQLSLSVISIHSPRMGRDCECVLLVPRGADISIHSPRMGRDGQGGGDDRPGSDFNPLSPHGERPLNVCRSELAELFQSTLPAWGETWLYTDNTPDEAISIHSPRMGRDGQG